MDYYQMQHGVAQAVEPFKTANSGQRATFRRIYPEPNFMTPDVRAILSLKKGEYLAEVSSGRMLDHYVYGITVIIRDENGAYKKVPPDSRISRCVFSPNELREYLEELDGQ